MNDKSQLFTLSSNATRTMKLNGTNDWTSKYNFIDQQPCIVFDNNWTHYIDWGLEKLIEKKQCGISGNQFIKYVSSRYQNRGVTINNQSSAHLSEITVKMSKTAQPASNSYTEKVEGTYTAVLIVEGTKVYVIHEVDH